MKHHDFGDLDDLDEGVGMLPQPEKKSTPSPDRVPLTNKLIRPDG